MDLIKFELTCFFNCDLRMNEQEDIIIDMVLQTNTSKDVLIKELKEVESNLKVENLSLKRKFRDWKTQCPPTQL